jgi:hypothetical protein
MDFFEYLRSLVGGKPTEAPEPAPAVFPPRVSLADFYKGRDTTYAAELTPEIEANAAITVERVNSLLEAFYVAMPEEALRSVNSGWRPPQVNATVKNAAGRSRHMTGEACDLSDDDEKLDYWLLQPDGQAALERIGLWMEHPSATPRWAHVQIVPPGSGRRVFMP